MIADYLTERFITLDGVRYRKLHLGEFFRLKKYRKEFFLSFNDKNRFKKSLEAVIELQTKQPIKEIDDLAVVLENVIQIFEFNEFENPPVALLPPPRNPTKQNPEKKKDRWIYPGEWMAQWIDSFARTYGWSLDKILDLDIDLAALLLQEIYLNDQFDKEFQYNLSEIAYQYDEHTKKSNHKPLKRPYWMLDAVDATIKTTKLLKSMLPIGVVMDLTGQGIVSANDKPLEETG